MEKYNIVLGYHMHPLTCGIARFNTTLAKLLKAEHLQVFNYKKTKKTKPLLSIKISEFNEIDKKKLEKFILRNSKQFSVFFHDFKNSNVEKKILFHSNKIFSGNEDIKKKISNNGFEVTSLWCPNSTDKKIIFKKKPITFFSFGMAHKVKTNYYKKLKKVMDKTKVDYAIYLSTALHENTNFEENFFDAFNELKHIFKKNIYFLGFLSDSAIYNYMRNATYFLAFFPEGIRENNTSAYTAFENKIPLITNLDRKSPKNFNHRENLIDINKIEKLNIEKKEIKKITHNAKKMYDKVYNWKYLIKKLNY